MSKKQSSPIDTVMFLYALPLIALFGLFLTAKATGLIAWSWLIVFSPLYPILLVAMIVVYQLLKLNGPDEQGDEP